VNQIVRFVKLDMMPAKVRIGSWPKWMLIMLQHGAKAVQRMLRIVRCFVKRITVQKETGRNANA
jgi:hypothetical protein